jgi:hypothetical protein
MVRPDDFLPPAAAGAGKGPRQWILHESNYRQLLACRPTVALLPWGATEAHNLHLPHGTDVIEAVALAEEAAALAVVRGARPIVLPAIPYGNDAQQLDQVATIHLSTTAALAILSDVAASLVRQRIDRLVLVNGHGGNEFKPLVRDAELVYYRLLRDERSGAPRQSGGEGLGQRAELQGVPQRQSLHPQRVHRPQRDNGR